MERAERIILALMLANEPLVALVGDRIYPELAPSEAPMPFVVYERRSAEAHTTIHGGVPFAYMVSMGVSAWALERDEALTIADAVTAALADVGTITNSFGHVDAPSETHCEVLEMDIWET